MGVRQVIALGTATFGALAALNSALTPPSAVPDPPGEPGTFHASDGDMFYTVQGTGPAIVLVHGLGLGASSAEMRFLVDVLARTQQVYALDLLGFGRSLCPAVSYTADLYVRLLTEFLQLVSGPASMVAAGASGPIALAVAAQQPSLVQALVLSSPPYPGQVTGIDAWGGALLHRAAMVPGAGGPLHNVLTTRLALKAVLRARLYANPDLVTEAMVDLRSAMARRRYANRAGLASLRGDLRLDPSPFLPDVGQPLLVVLGTGATQSPLAVGAAFVRLCPHAQILLMDHAASLPHEEQAERFASATLSWVCR
jgi:pimeloyl-ACP methyl ester carboxylesterase